MRLPLVKLGDVSTSERYIVAENDVDLFNPNLYRVVLSDIVLEAVLHKSVKSLIHASNPESFEPENP